MIHKQSVKLRQCSILRLSWLSVNAKFFLGVIHGLRETQGTPRISFSDLPTTDPWFTRHRFKTNHTTYPLMIHRFTNNSAEFIFIGLKLVTGVAGHYWATQLHVTHVSLTHQSYFSTFIRVLGQFDVVTNPIDREFVINHTAKNVSESSTQAVKVLDFLVKLIRVYSENYVINNTVIQFDDALYHWDSEIAAEIDSSLPNAS